MNTTILKMDTHKEKVYCTRIISNGAQHIENNYVCSQPPLDTAALDEIHKRKKSATKTRDIKFN